MNKRESIKSKELPVINRLAIVLKEERRSNRWLAAETGFTETTVSKWTTNTKQPNIYTLYLIALILKRDLQDFFISTKIMNEESRISEIQVLMGIAEKGKRTGGK